MNEKAKCKNCTNEMIEEMAKDIYDIIPDLNYGSYDIFGCYRRMAERHYEQGYRKIPDGSVVLTKEEYNELKSRAEEVFNEMTERMKAEVKIAKRMGVIKGSKETAKEILKEVKSLLFPEEADLLAWLVAIADKYGVEVEE
jgi:hypothetical protein